MSVSLSTLTPAELDAVRVERKAEADAAFLAMTDGVVMPSQADRRRVDRLTAQQERVLGEYSRRGLPIEH